MTKEGKRWSGAEWADEKRNIMIVGCGGIGSWTALTLGRIDHSLFLIDHDSVDQTNVTGGQMFQQSQVGQKKVRAVQQNLRAFGCTSGIMCVDELFDTTTGISPITIAAVDNMAARKLIFEEWVKTRQKNPYEDYLFIDSRLTLEMYEVFCISTDEQIEEYRTNHLFSSEEAAPVDCTAKQSTFTAMGIASMITTSICNWLTNRKLEADFREVPFYSRFYAPLMRWDKTEIGVFVEAS